MYIKVLAIEPLIQQQTKRLISINLTQQMTKRVLMKGEKMNCLSG